MLGDFVAASAHLGVVLVSDSFTCRLGAAPTDDGKVFGYTQTQKNIRKWLKQSVIEELLLQSEQLVGFELVHVLLEFWGNLYLLPKVIIYGSVWGFRPEIALKIVNWCNWSESRASQSCKTLQAVQDVNEEIPLITYEEVLSWRENKHFWNKILPNVIHLFLGSFDLSLAKNQTTGALNMKQPILLQSTIG